MNRRSFARGASLAMVASAFGLSRPARGEVNDDIERAIAAAQAAFASLSPLGLPGTLIGLVRPHRDIVRLAFGVADLQNLVPMSIQMTMRLGSIAKLFVGTVALQLVDEGRLDLDAPVSSFRSDVPNGTRITVRMLGTHTSGLFNPLRDPAFRDRINRSPSRHISREEIISVAFANSRHSGSNTSFQYSNTNTIILAEILERLTGTPIDTLMQERLLRPAGATGIQIPETSALIEPSARGYRHGAAPGRIEYGSVLFDATAFSASWADAAGNLNGRLEDLLRIGRQLANGEFLSEASRTQQRAFIDGGGGLAYGFCIARYGQVIGHAGDVPGFSSFLGYVPVRDVLVVVLCNLSNLADKSAPATRIATSMVDALTS